MDRSKLIIEKPVMTDVVVTEEIDGILSEANHELANYAATHLGYGRLSSRLDQEEAERRQRAAGIAQTNNLPVALQRADINVYSAKSVKKYKGSMVRQGWAKFIFSPDECALWFSLFLIMPAVAGFCFLMGWLSGWQAAVLSAVFQLPCIPYSWKGLRACIGIGDFIWRLALVFSPMIGLGLAVSGFGKGWLAPTFLFGFLGVMFFADVFVKQMKESKIYWARVPIREYNDEIPLFALSKMVQIHKHCPSAVFSVEVLKADIYLPDPFLVVTDSVTGKDFYIEVWNEPKFEAEI